MTIRVRYPSEDEIEREAELLLAEYGETTGAPVEVPVPVEEISTYPGELATPDQVRRLADEYRKAAHHLFPLGRKGEPLSRAPFRFSAIHAIELYLNAFLLHRGQEAVVVRGLQHNLAARTDLALQKGLILRRRTVAHLHSMTTNREYLVMRYGPETTATASQVNRLSATLDEVAGKVTPAILAMN